MEQNKAIALQNAAIDIAKTISENTATIPAAAYVKPASPDMVKTDAPPAIIPLNPKSTTPAPTATPSETWFPINVLLGGSGTTPVQPTSNGTNKMIMYMGIGVLALILFLIVFGLIKR